MLEELTPDEADRLKAAGLDTLLPYAQLAPRWNAAGTGLLSRYPLSDEDVRHDFPFEFVSARIAVPGLAKPPTAVALHMYGPYPSRQTPTWERDIAHVHPVLQALPSDAPVVVGGDFNATPSVTQFRRLLTGGFADAADQAGAGLTPTYPANRLIPLIAIDHVLTRDAVARSVDAVRLPGSDHRGLLVTVRLPSS
jgi:endonuclease/exonuclease/phosphatase family metal-dependent hydrolase